MQSAGTDILCCQVSVAVIMAIWTVLLFYLWLCVVSHYQILGEVMSMGSDKVKVLQEVKRIVLNHRTHVGYDPLFIVGG